MDAVEKAIRNALEKGDASDRAFREKVYRSAFAALERSLQAKPDLAPEEAERRRDSLKHGITQIESEFVPAVAHPGDTGQQAEAPPVSAEHDEGHGGSAGDALRASRDEDARDDDWDHSRDDPPQDPRQENVSDEAIDAVQADERERWRPARQRRLGGSRIPVLALALLVLAVIAGAVWWAVSGAPGDRAPSTGAGGQESTVDDILREQSDGAAPADEAADDDGSGQATGPATVPDQDWITVFSPSDATAIGAPPGADAEIVQGEGEDERFVRITAPDANTALRFDVGQGALETLAGGGVVFSILARAEEGEETQMSVSCDLGAMGDCGRKRFVVGATRSEYLLEVDTSGSAPDAAGTISIVPDITGEGRALDLFEIRASRASG